MPENPSTSAPAAPVISSRILGLKFMQKHRASKGEPAAPPESVPVAEPSLSSSAKWRLDLPGGLAVAPAAVVLTEPPALSGPQALLQFRAGRRSYGAFNPKLEVRAAAEEHYSPKGGRGGWADGLGVGEREGRLACEERRAGRVSVPALPPTGAARRFGRKEAGSRGGAGGGGGGGDAARAAGGGGCRAAGRAGRGGRGARRGRR